MADPLLSVVLATTGHRSSVAKTLAHLRAQTRRSELELVVVAPAASLFALPDSDVRGLADSRVVLVEELGSKADAHATGVRAARGAVIAFVEDHSFPDADWAEALLARHEGPCAAVGPVLRNANPDSLVSWCDLLINYGPWLDPAGAGFVGELPGHNTSYKRAALQAYDGRLAEWLDVENELHGDMKGRGETLYLEPAARVAHVNLSRASAWLPAAFYAARVYAAERARLWSPARRFGYVALAPLIPFVRWARLLRSWPREVPGLPTRARMALLLLLGFAADAGGQALGYAAGVGQAGRRMTRYEFDRHRFVRAADQGTLQPEPAVERKAVGAA